MPIVCEILVLVYLLVSYQQEAEFFFLVLYTVVFARSGILRLYFYHTREYKIVFVKGYDACDASELRLRQRPCHFAEADDDPDHRPEFIFTARRYAIAWVGLSEAQDRSRLTFKQRN